MIAVIFYSIPLCVKAENPKEQGHQELNQENYAGKKNKKRHYKKFKRNAYISGFFTVSSLVSLVGVITSKALSDVSVHTIASKEPILVDKINEHTFIEYEDLLHNYDHYYNRLSSTCKYLDAGLDDLLQKYKGVDDIEVDARIFRDTLLNKKCGMFIPEKTQIDLPNISYSTSDIHAHLDSFAIQVIALSAVAIVSGAFLSHYACKACEQAKNVEQGQENNRDRRIEAEFAGDEPELRPGRKKSVACNAKMSKNHLLSIALCGVFACTSDCMKNSLHPFKLENLVNTDAFGQNDEGNIFAYFNQTHTRLWNDLLKFTETMQQMDSKIAEIEEVFDQDQLGFGMVIASDTQLPWGRKDDNNVTDQEWIESGIETNRYHASSMNKLQILGKDFSKVQAVIINGDLTAYAHPWQWVLYKRIYDSSAKDSYPEVLRMPVYPGLGNHDYQNNVDSCWGPWYSVLIDQNNWCAKNSIYKLKRDLAKTNISNFDEGSLSYSWNVDHIHFVQLHNFPNYNSSKIHIEDSLAWLDEDLKRAESERRLTVLNFHIKKITPELKKILKKYEILGLFVGHYHSLVGKKSKIKSAKGDSPVYYSGSASYNLFNYVYFTAHKMVVYSVDSSSGKPVIRERYTQAFN